MTPPPPPNTWMCSPPRCFSRSTMYLKYSTCPPWYELIAMPCTSSCSAAVTTSSTERLWPRWITSVPMLCRMRRMMLIAASCPSNSDAAVTKRTWFAGRYSAMALNSADRSVIGSSLDLRLQQRRVARRIAQVQAFEGALDHGGHHQVAMRLRIGRHDRPRRPFGAGGGDRLGIGGLVLVPLLARVDVAALELPALGGVVDARLQPLALLVLRDVEHELENHRTGLAEHALEVVDVRVALARLLRRDGAVDRRHQHVLVVAAVEDGHRPAGRHALVDAPHEVVRRLVAARRLPPDGVDPERAHAAENAADGAVLAAGVGAL